MIVDLSFAHDSVTAAQLTARGATGVIGYVSQYPAKNVTASNLLEWMVGGLTVGLVYEDSTDDMLASRAIGQANGLRAVNQAKAIGYDTANCVIFASNDRNAQVADYPTILAYMQGFAYSVPVPGYYGDQDSIDYLHAIHPDWWYWQSDSTSFGIGVSPHAHLIQRYADSRVAGLPVDANDVLITGLPLMGDDMYTQADRDRDNKVATQVGVISYSEGLELPAISEIRGNAQNIARAVTGLHTAPDPAALAAALAPLIHSVGPVELQAALAQVLGNVKLTIAPS